MYARPNWRFVSVMGVLLAMGTAGGLIWHKVNSVPAALREKMSLLENLKFKDILNTDAVWDPEIVKLCLAEHADLVGRIEYIASLTTRSSANMPADYQGFVGAYPGKTGCDILLLKARLAADAGDETESLRLVAAAANMSSHYHDVECPALYNETVAVLTSLTIDQAVFELLMLEQAGVILTAGDTGRVTRAPVSHNPFEFDAAKRVLSAPPASAGLDVRPLALPW